MHNDNIMLRRDKASNEQATIMQQTISFHSARAPHIVFTNERGIVVPLPFNLESGKGDTTMPGSSFIKIF